MIQKKHRGMFTLYYEPADDSGYVCYASRIIARWNSNHWDVCESIFCYCDEWAMKEVYHLRALMGLDQDFFARTARLASLYDLQTWKRLHEQV